MENTWSHADAPSGLTRSERDELAALMNKLTWTTADKRRIAQLKGKMH